MKKILVLAVAAAAAIATLSAFASTSGPASPEGRVSFESAALPALNCSVSIGHAMQMYYLLPGNIEDICRKEYAAIRQKCNSRSHFTHEGVDVRIKDNGKTITIEFCASGYKVVASNVTWNQLDNMFIGPSKTPSA